MHNLLHVIFDETPPFSYLTVPNHRHNPWACLYEVGLVLAMLVVIRFLTKGRPPRIPPAPAAVAQP
jgi:hypothetical protein